MAKLLSDILMVVTPQDWGSFVWGAVVSGIICFILFCTILFFMSAGRSGERIDRVFQENQERNANLEPASQTHIEV